MERCSGRKERLMGLLLAEAAGAELPTLDEAGKRGKRMLTHIASVQASAAKVRKSAVDRDRAITRSRNLEPDTAADRCVASTVQLLVDLTSLLAAPYAPAEPKQ
eukprot:644123-Prymnesium_polylepis.1